MLRILSLGAGVQSTALALMSTDGTLPPLDYAIFSDTGWEPAGVYEHLDRLEAHLTTHGTTVIRCRRGDIRVDSLDPEKPTYIPFNTASGGQVRRQCTSNYKLFPMFDEVRRLLGAKVTYDDDGRRRVGRTRWTDRCEMWVGISTDEIERVKPSDRKYIERVDPLVDWLDMSRQDCHDYLGSAWDQPVQRSACIGCPFHSNEEWRRMRDEDPVSWVDAVEFDNGVRARGGIYADFYLHTDRIPLGQVDLDTPRRGSGQPVKYRKRGCGPWSCPSEE